MRKKSIVVVGGGTGTHTVLRGLRRYAEQVDITAIVSMSDSGGSAGRLRDEFGQLPVGDVRNAITALASEEDESDLLLRQLFLFRFNRGQGLAGHNFGNLLISALTEILGSEVKAIEATAKILRISGKVLPVTTDNVHLVAEYEDGTIIVGEHYIDTPPDDASRSRITKLYLQPEAQLSLPAKEAILNADLIVLGPGDLYTSILANCVVGGFAEAVQASAAKTIYVCNLMSKQGQTVGMGAMEHVEEINKYLGLMPDAIIVNNTLFSEDLIKKYADEGDYPILNNCDTDKCIVYADSLVAEEEIKQVSGDVVKRSLIRHDSDKLASILFHIL